VASVDVPWHAINTEQCSRFEQEGLIPWKETDAYQQWRKKRHG
jgi:hypothetical protein